MKYPSVIFFLIHLISLPLQGQPVNQTITGQVSFISSQNIYVRFRNTTGINVNDTLYIPSGENFVPVLVVNNMSSTSCLCTSVSEEDLPAGHIIIAKIKPSEEVRKVKTPEEIKNATPLPSAEKEPVIQEKSVTTSDARTPVSATKQNINGSIAAASYSNFSNTPGTDIQRFRYTLSLNARNIAGSGFSAETYTSFRHKYGDWDEVTENIFNALKIYSLAVKYDIDSTAHLRLGRQINPRISSIGSFDGLEFEKSINRFTTGLIAGFRPDYVNYGFNSDLLQFGGYLAYDIFVDRAYSRTSLAFMEQLNSGKTDRRFLYFQNSGTPFRNTSLFSSFEIDLFELKNDEPASTFNLTSLYISINYRLSSRLTVGGSYDARKNPVYYETYKTLLDSLTETGLRQSYRLQASIRITKSLLFGLQSSWRHLKTDPLQSMSLSGYLTYTYPGDNTFSATLSGNYIETSYLKGLTTGIKVSKSMLAGKIHTGVGYSYQDYTLPENQNDIIQHTGKADLYLQATEKTSLSFNYELTFEKERIYNRLYVLVRRRF